MGPAAGGAGRPLQGRAGGACGVTGAVCRSAHGRAAGRRLRAA